MSKTHEDCPGPVQANLGRTRVFRALHKSPGVKKHGKQDGDGPGARFGRFGGAEALKSRPKFLEKCANIFGSGTGREIGVFHAPGALHKTPSSEKRGEEARSGPGAKFP